MKTKDGVQRIPDVGTVIGYMLTALPYGIGSTGATVDWVTGGRERKANSLAGILSFNLG